MYLTDYLTFTLLVIILSMFCAMKYNQTIEFYMLNLKLSELLKRPHKTPEEKFLAVCDEIGIHYILEKEECEGEKTTDVWIVGEGWDLEFAKKNSNEMYQFIDGKLGSY